MNQPIITFIINKKPYRLCVSNVEAIRDMPGEDRQPLIALLEAIKREETAAQQVSAKVSGSAVATSVNIDNAPGQQDIKSERMKSGNVDALMAQLIMEDRTNRNPGLTKQMVQKWAVVFIVVVFVLMLMI